MTTPPLTKEEEEQDAEYMQIKRLCEIIRQGSKTTRDFYATYRAEKKKEDELRRQRKVNTTSS